MEEKLIRELDTAELKRQFNSAEPFRFLCIDNLLDPDFAREIAGAYPNQTTAREMGLEFDAVNERYKVQITDPEKFPDPVKRLASVFATEEFRKMLSEITGIDDLIWDPNFHGGGMHQTAVSGRLDVHVDFNRLGESGLYRRLNLLLYLNEDWKSEWGGQVELWDKDVKRCYHSLDPVLNRCVIFETSDISFHGVRKLDCPPHRVRRSFALYYYSKEPPLYASRFGDHTTIFKARPDEKLRRYVLMPAERIGREVSRGIERAKNRASRLLSTALNR